MTLKVELTLQRPPEWRGLNCNIALLDALLTHLDGIMAPPLAIGLENPATVELVLLFSREREGEYYTDPDEADEWAMLLFERAVTWLCTSWEVREFVPDTEPDEAESKANAGLGVRPFS